MNECDHENEIGHKCKSSSPSSCLYIIGYMNQSWNVGRYLYCRSIIFKINVYKQVNWGFQNKHVRPSKELELILSFICTPVENEILYPIVPDLVLSSPIHVTIELKNKFNAISYLFISYMFSYFSLFNLFADRHRKTSRCVHKFLRISYFYIQTASTRERVYRCAIYSFE